MFNFPFEMKDFAQFSNVHLKGFSPVYCYIITLHEV